MAPAGGTGRLVGDYLLLQHIGSGSFAEVWKAQHQETQAVVAIKEIATDRLNRKLKQSLESEVSILRRISHRNVVTLETVLEVGNKLYLVMEFCAGGDLSCLIRRQGRVSEDTARCLMQQLAMGLRELWSHHLVHRDLKPQNLLLAGSGPEAVLKIADFGFARDLQPQGLAETLCGSPLYMAPEILKFCKYDSKADLWSIGTILFELVVGRPPFTGINQMQLVHNIDRHEPQIPPELLSELSPHLLDLMAQLLQRNPLQRIGFEEFFSHPFLAPAAAPGSSPPSPQASTIALHHPALAVAAGAAARAPPGKQSDTSQPSVLHPWDDCAGPLEALPFVVEPVGGGQRGEARAGPAGIELPAVRFVAPPAVLAPSSEGSRGLGDMRSSGGSSMRSAQLGQPLMDSLAEEDDYVFVDALPSPHSSDHHSRSGSANRSGSSTPAHSRGTKSPSLVPPPNHAQRHSDTASSAKAGAAAGNSSPQGGLVFTLGVSRLEALRKVARLLDGDLPYHPCASPAPGAALVLRLLALQVLGGALELCQRDPGAAGVQGSAQPLAELLTGDMRGICQRADQAGAAATGTSQSAGALPDVWELVFQAALSLARSAAVDELLGNTAACLRSYSKAAALFYFMFAEAPHLPLQPPLALSPADVHRLQNYTARIAMRYQAAAGASGAGGPATGVAAHPPGGRAELPSRPAVRAVG